jgi:hypothetical protein
MAERALLRGQLKKKKKKKMMMMMMRMMKRKKHEGAAEGAYWAWAAKGTVGTEQPAQG